MCQIFMNKREFRAAKDFFRKAKACKPKTKQVLDQIKEIEKYISRIPGDSFWYRHLHSWHLRCVTHLCAGNAAQQINNLFPYFILPAAGSYNLHHFKQNFH